MVYQQHSNHVVSANAEAYKKEGNDEYRKKDLSKAIHFYTEGIKVNCKDDELNAKLYSNRAIAHFYLGENLFLRRSEQYKFFFCCPGMIKWLKWNFFNRELSWFT